MAAPFRGCVQQTLDRNRRSVSTSQEVARILPADCRVGRRLRLWRDGSSRMRALEPLNFFQGVAHGPCNLHIARAGTDGGRQADHRLGTPPTLCQFVSREQCGEGCVHGLVWFSCSLGDCCPHPVIRRHDVWPVIRLFLSSTGTHRRHTAATHQTPHRVHPRRPGSGCGPEWNRHSAPPARG